MKHKNSWNYRKNALKVIGMSYQQYLQSNHWIFLKKAFYASGLFKGCCEVCFNPNVPLQIHHKSYKRLGKERLNDLIAVCGDCHLTIHKRVGITSRTNVWNAHKSLKRKNLKFNNNKQRYF